MMSREEIIDMAKKARLVDPSPYTMPWENKIQALERFASLVAEKDVRQTPSETFQDRVNPWLLECFGPVIAGDREERNHRFLEEALELVQSCGCTASEAYQLVDYVYGRPVGDVFQEIGGVMVTLAALCLANGSDMHRAGEEELSRVWTKVEQIRAKQAAKPKHSPLPQHVTTQPVNARLLEVLKRLERAAWSREISMGDPSSLIAAKAELADAARNASAAIAAAEAQQATRTQVPGSAQPAPELVEGAPCRNALRRDGKPFPKSSCQRCGTLIRPGWKCADGVEV